MPDLNINTVAANLAVEMTARSGEMWRVVTNADRWTHIESPSACLSLRESWRTHRVEIQATAPHSTREKTTGKIITCDPARTAEAIARDIEIRLLAHARAHLEESIAYDRRLRREESAAKLRRNIIRQYTDEEFNGKQYRRSKDRERRLWVDVNDYNNTATIEITLPFGEAIKLLKEIQEGEYIK